MGQERRRSAGLRPPPLGVGRERRACACACWMYSAAQAAATPRPTSAEAAASHAKPRDACWVGAGFVWRLWRLAWGAAAVFGGRCGAAAASGRARARAWPAAMETMINATVRPYSVKGGSSGASSMGTAIMSMQNAERGASLGSRGLQQGQTLAGSLRRRGAAAPARPRHMRTASQGGGSKPLRWSTRKEKTNDSEVTNAQLMWVAAT